MNIDIKARLESIRSTLADGVTLVAVSKFHPLEALREAYDAGQRDFGESRVQELAAKAAAMPADVRWHFIGHLQTNKVRQLLPCVGLIHSIDSLRLLQCVDKEARRIGKTVDVLLQLHVAAEETKFGFTPDECARLVESGALSSLTAVRVRGLMAMATNTDNFAQVEAEFRRVCDLFNSLKAGPLCGNPEFSEIRIVMIYDYPIAMRCGSTIVRIGSSIFGERQY